MLFVMAFIAQRHQVVEAQRNCWVTQVIRRERYPVMDLCRGRDQPSAHAPLAQPTALPNECRPALSPSSGRVKRLNVRVFVHGVPTITTGPADMLQAPLNKVSFTC